MTLCSWSHCFLRCRFCFLFSDGQKQESIDCVGNFICQKKCRNGLKSGDDGCPQCTCLEEGACSTTHAQWIPETYLSSSWMWLLLAINPAVYPLFFLPGVVALCLASDIFYIYNILFSNKTWNMVVYHTFCNLKKNIFVFYQLNYIVAVLYKICTMCLFSFDLLMLTT